jgi:dTMP kinase
MPLIVIEGLDAAGKTTQTKLLENYLLSEGFKVHTLDFPQYDNNVFGLILKKFLANDFGDSVSLDPRLSAMLFAGDRLESKTLLDAWLSDPNVTVILNRYIPSNIAYNRAKAGNNPTKKVPTTKYSAEDAQNIEDFICNLEYTTFQMPKPDLVIVLGSSSAITKARLQEETDAYESDANFLDKVACEYLKMCEKNPDLYKLYPITKDQTPQDVHIQLCNIWYAHFCGAVPE